MKKNTSKFPKYGRIFSFKIRNLRHALALFKKIISDSASTSELEQMENIIFNFLPFSYSPHETSPKNMYRHIEFTSTDDQLIMNFSKNSEFNLFHDAYQQLEECIEDHVPYSEIYELSFYSTVMYDAFCDPRFLTEVHNETGFATEALKHCFNNFFDDLIEEVATDMARFFEDKLKLLDSRNQQRIQSTHIDSMLLDYLV